MSFVSLEFLVFVLICTIVYFCVSKKYRWIVLLVSSYAFYFISEHFAFLFLLFTTVTTFYTGILIGKVNDSCNEAIKAQESISRNEKKRLKAITKKKKRWILCASLLVNFGILAFLKYFNFGMDIIDSVFSVSTAKLNLLLPLGISFYTFQSMGYIIDVYRGKFEPDTNIAKFALFVSFFPQIVQGPIGRYDHLASQLYKGHTLQWERIKNGGLLILWGVFKKLVIADRLYILVNEITGNYTEYAGSVIFFGVCLNVLQVYMDFSGGIDIARGVAQIFGIDMAENFRRPYFAKSVSEFWRRWHITLGAWMRDYIFYPLSLSKSATRAGRFFRKIFGNYVGKVLPTSIASLIVFTIVGIWHGARFGYVAYGFYYGILIGSSTLLAPVFRNVIDKCRIRTECFSWRLFQILRTVFLVGVGRYFTIAPRMTISIKMLGKTITDFNLMMLLNGSVIKRVFDGLQISELCFAVIILFVISLIQEKGIKIRNTLSRQNIIFRYLIYISLIFGILILAAPGTSIGDFIYEKF